MKARIIKPRDYIYYNHTECLHIYKSKSNKCFVCHNGKNWILDHWTLNTLSLLNAGWKQCTVEFAETRLKELINNQIEPESISGLVYANNISPSNIYATPRVLPQEMPTKYKQYTAIDNNSIVYHPNNIKFAEKPTMVKIKKSKKVPINAEYPVYDNADYSVP